jgi:hypothetical protein
MKVHGLLVAATFAATPMAALADFTPYVVNDQHSSSGYSPRTTVRPTIVNDQASMSLLMIDANSNSVAINTGGEVNVQRGPTFTNIGTNRNGGGAIMASWDEVQQGNNVFINAVFKTSDGSMFMPPNALVNGQPAFFWSWHFGTANQVNYYPWIDSVSLLSARIFFSDNGGQSFNSFSNIAGLGNSFMNGRDNGNYLATIGDGTNYIMLQYQINAIPAPAGLAALAGGAMILGRRRRR